MPHFPVIVLVCMVDQCYGLPQQKLTKVENLISSNSGPSSIAVEHSWWLLQFTTLIEAFWDVALLSKRMCLPQNVTVVA